VTPLSPKSRETQSIRWKDWRAHGPTRRSYGHALVVDPWGVIVAECSDEEGFALARLDFAHQDKLRAALPVLTHRRL